MIGRVATPVSIAARATAGAILRISRWSNGLGMMCSGPYTAGWPVGDTSSPGSCASLAIALDGRELHLLVDRGRPDVERAAEDEGET